MAKRLATTQMTHDNWDEEEDVEDPGKFAAASTEEISQRRIRVAKRRLGSQDSKSPTGSAFGGFSGFGKSPGTMATSSLFGTASVGISSGASSSSFGTALPSLSATAKAPTATLSFGLMPTSTPMTNKLPELVAQPPKASAAAAEQQASAPTAMINSTSNDQKKEEISSEFYGDLRALNESVIAWMQANFQEDAYVDFTPVFNDYKTHFKELEQRHHVKTAALHSTTNNGKAPAKATAADSVGVSINGSLAPVATSAPSPAAQPFRFGLSNASASIAPSTTSAAPTVTAAAPVPSATAPKPFSFGLGGAASKDTPSTFQTTTSAPLFGGFGSGGNASSTAAPFSFGVKPSEKNVDGEDKDTADGGDEEGEYQPPKPERVEQVEEGAVFSIRCKLFFKKESKFVEKGVGTLFLKPLDTGKTQLLIRADTATGTVLLNISLNDKIPCTRNGKNNVSLICIPHPPLDPKSKTNEPAALLIRVKTEEDADELLDEMNKAKNSG